MQLCRICKKGKHLYTWKRLRRSQQSVGHDLPKWARGAQRTSEDGLVWSLLYLACWHLEVWAALGKCAMSWQQSACRRQLNPLCKWKLTHEGFFTSLLTHWRRFNASVGECKSKTRCKMAKAAARVPRGSGASQLAYQAVSSCSNSRPKCPP